MCPMVQNKKSAQIFQNTFINLKLSFHDVSSHIEISLLSDHTLLILWVLIIDDSTVHAFNL